MLCSKPHNTGFHYKETPMTSGLVYQHMSSHYRRILNAKPVVDTSAPQTFKPRLVRSGKPRRRPASSSAGYNKEEFPRNGSFTADDCRLDWPRRDEKSPLKPSRISNNCPMDRGQKKRERGDLLERHNDQFEAYRLNFCPRILKTDASSKLRGMRVYHPPRRITNFTSSEWVKDNLEKGEEIVGQESSRDSAYNGGTSSTPDSHSPSCHQKPLSSHVKHAATQTEAKATRKQSERQPEDEDDAVYTKFIHDIVVEMTDKELFTNCALTKVMFRHYSSHLNSLDKDKMLREIRKLRDKLGMPEMSDDFQAKELPEEPPPFVTTPAEPYTDPPSWTSIYKQLKERTVNSCSDEVVESITENVTTTSETKRSDE